MKMQPCSHAAIEGMPIVIRLPTRQPILIWVSMYLLGFVITSSFTLTHGTPPDMPEQQFREMTRVTAELCFDHPLDIALAKAIEQNDLVAMQKALDNGANVNASGTGGMSPVMFAAMYEKFERVQLLLDAGADPTLPVVSPWVHRFNGPQRAFNRYPGMKLTTLAASGEYEPLFDMCLRASHSLEVADFLYQSLPELIGHGLSSEKLRRFQLFVGRGGDINLRAENESTCLDRVIGMFDFELAESLLDLGVDSHYIRRGGFNGDFTVTEILLLPWMQGVRKLPIEFRRQKIELIRRVSADGPALETVLAERFQKVGRWHKEWAHLQWLVQGGLELDLKALDSYPLRRKGQ